MAGNFTHERVPFSLENLATLNEGELALQFAEAVEDIERLRENLPAYQTKDGAGKCKVVITLDLMVSADRIDIDSSVKPTLPARKKLKDRADVTDKGLMLTREMQHQENLPLRSIKGETK